MLIVSLCNYTLIVFNFITVLVATFQDQDVTTTIFKHMKNVYLQKPSQIKLILHIQHTFIRSAGLPTTRDTCWGGVSDEIKTGLQRVTGPLSDLVTVVAERDGR